MFGKKIDVGRYQTPELTVSFELRVVVEGTLGRKNSAFRITDDWDDDEVAGLLKKYSVSVVDIKDLGDSRLEIQLVRKFPVNYYNPKAKLYAEIGKFKRNIEDFISKVLELDIVKEIKERKEHKKRGRRGRKKKYVVKEVEG